MPTPSHPQLPVYLVALRDKWLAHGTSDAALAFGTADEARSRVADEALEQGLDPSLFRVVEYVFSGRVTEG